MSFENCANKISYFSCHFVVWVGKFAFDLVHAVSVLSSIFQLPFISHKVEQLVDLKLGNHLPVERKEKSPWEWGCSLHTRVSLFPPSGSHRNWRLLFVHVSRKSNLKLRPRSSTSNIECSTTNYFIQYPYYKFIYFDNGFTQTK